MTIVVTGFCGTRGCGIGSLVAGLAGFLATSAMQRSGYGKIDRINLRVSRNILCHTGDIVPKPLVATSQIAQSGRDDKVRGSYTMPKGPRGGLSQGWRDEAQGRRGGAEPHLLGTRQRDTEPAADRADPLKDISIILLIEFERTYGVDSINR
jgi:hypothetical protein